MLTTSLCDRLTARPQMTSTALGVRVLNRAHKNQQDMKHRYIGLRESRPSCKRKVCCSDSARQSQDQVKQSRTTQEKTTKVLAELLQAPNTAAAAKKHIDSINEEFLMVSSTYLDMAKKEGNPEVCRKLEEVLKVAMEEKQKTLRPEIQLLNMLMAATTVPERESVLSHVSAQQALTMNNGYFFGLLDRMIADVKRQPDNKRKQDLMEQLEQINDRTDAQRQTVTNHVKY